MTTEDEAILKEVCNDTTLKKNYEGYSEEEVLKAIFLTREAERKSQKEKILEILRK